MLLPSKYETFVCHLYNVGPTSKTLGRRSTNVLYFLGMLSWLYYVLYHYLFITSYARRCKLIFNKNYFY